MKRPKAWRNVPKDKLTTMATAADNISEAQFKLREIARPMWTDTREGSLRRAARALGISASAAERIVYRKCKRIDSHVMDNIRAAYARLEARAEQAADLQLERARAAQAGFHAADTKPTDEHYSTDRQRNVPRG